MKLKSLLLAISLLILNSCATKYITPGGSVNISELADEDISKILSNKPTAKFPVNIAIVRIQAPRYTNLRYNRSQYSKPNGNFSMVLTRNSQEDEAFERLEKMDGVKQASPFNRLLLPYEYKSIKDLRLAAAKMKAQILLVYTFDTEFIIDTKNYGPQNVLALGYLKNKEVKVVTTASVAIFDVQTEYLYGLAETTSRINKKSNAWKKQDQVDALRIQTEKEAFKKLIIDIEKLWIDIKNEYSK